MTVTSSPRRHSMRLAVVAAVGITVAVSGCGAGAASHEGDQGTRASASASAPAPADAGQAAGGQAAAGPSGENQCGGMTIDDSAPITSSTDILVDAPLDHVWDVHTDVERWSEWQDAVMTIERLDDGAFASDSRFRWTTPVPESEFAPADTLTITSSVQRMEPGRCVIWEGPAIGDAITIDQGTHLWTFTEVDGGTLVHTEESWDAEILDTLPEADVAPVATMLGGGLEIWLQTLKTEAEKQA